MEFERSVKEWIKLMNRDPDFRVRLRAVEALAKRGDSKAFKPLR
jgi:HEAT repeat protein